MKLIKGKLGKLDVGDELPVRVFGVINLSKTSFYQSSIASSSKEIELAVKKMVDEGMDGLDFGAQSTRPIQIYGGEGRVDEETEFSIIKNASKIILDTLSSYNNVELSVDTTRSSIAEYALNQGIEIINDISGFKKDNKMAKTIAEFDASAVLMAAKQEPGDIYKLEEIKEELRISTEIGVDSGIREENIVLDPGIGSWEARDYKHDYKIIQKLVDFRILNKPIYVGISRKTSIGKALNNAPSDERLYGSLGATIVAVVNGAHIVRTHDVKPTQEAIRVAEAIIRFKEF